MAISPVTLTRDVVTQYAKTGTSGQKPDGIWMQPLVRDFIPLMSDLDTPMADIIGPASFTTDQNELLFGEGDIVPGTTLANGNQTNVDTTILVDDATVFQKYSKVRNERTGELYYVTAVDDTTQIITVVRDFPAASGTGIAILDDDVLRRMGPATPEGADVVPSPVAFGDTDNNFCEIKEYSWTFTHRGRITPDLEVKGDRFRHEEKKKMKEAVIDLEHDFLWGLKNEGDGTAASTNNPSTMGGIFEATSTNAFPGGGNPLELTDFLTLMETVAKDVGKEAMGKQLMMSFKGSRIFASYFKGNRRYPGTGDIKLTEDGFISDFGHITKVINQRLDDDKIILINGKDLKRGWFEGGAWSHGLYTTQGWYDRGFLRCDIGALWTGDRRRAKWTAFSVADADYPNLDVV